MSKLGASVAAVGGFFLAGVITPMRYYKKSISIDTTSGDNYLLNNSQPKAAAKTFLLMPLLMLKGAFWDSWANYPREFYKAGAAVSSTNGFAADFQQSLRPLTYALSPTKILKPASERNSKHDSFIGQDYYNIPTSPYVMSAAIASFSIWLSFAGTAIIRGMMSGNIGWISPDNSVAMFAHDIFAFPLQLGEFITGASFDAMPSSGNALSFFIELGESLAIVSLTALAVTIAINAVIGLVEGAQSTAKHAGDLYTKFGIGYGALDFDNVNNNLISEQAPRTPPLGNTNTSKTPDGARRQGKQDRQGGGLLTTSWLGGGSSAPATDDDAGLGLVDDNDDNISVASSNGGGGGGGNDSNGQSNASSRRSSISSLGGW